jgi:hypothetical protein
MRLENNYEWWVGKDLEGGVCSPFQVMYQHSPRQTEENNEEPYAG